MHRTSLIPAAAFLVLLGAGRLPADPLTKSLDLDFGRDVASRDLKGLATTSDGRIVPGPVLTPLSGPAVGELLWTLAPAGADRWLVGTGPEGRIMEITLAGARYTVRQVARLEEPQVFALQPLPDGTLLAGTSPTGALYLLKDGKPVARVILPVDSIFDLLLLPPAPIQNPQSQIPNPVVLVATGNPGRIYRVDLARFAAAGINADQIADPKVLASKGITLFGEIRDRNVRRLVRLADGRIAAGSVPRGNVYAFPAAGGAPLMLQENRDAEVTDLLPQPNGDLYASIVFSTGSGPQRINRPRPVERPTPAGALPAEPTLPEPAPPTAGNENAAAPAAEALPADVPRERFTGRSSVVRFPAGGFPETLLGRNGLAFYRLARRGDLVLIAAGEEGGVLAWDLKARLSLTLPGATGAQLNGLAPLGGGSDRFLLLQNNAAGLDLLDFAGAGPRQLETKRLDLGVPAELGNLRFDSLRHLTPEDLRIEIRTSFGSDETEGWSDWTPLGVRDGAFYAPGLRGRYVRLRLTVPADRPDFALDTATLYDLPQDRAPVLTDFRLLPANYALNPAPEPLAPAVLTLGQVLNPNQPPTVNDGDAKRKNSFLGSQLVPDPGSQVAYWTVSDADGDTLAYTFSLRPAGTDHWTDVAVNIRDNYAQFDISSLADGLYRTRLVVAEQAPRPTAQRLRVEFTTDDLLVDHTPPTILDASVRREGTSLIVTVHGRDALSLLDGAEFDFNNGYSQIVTHPVDGILDGREETFVLETPLQNVTGATAVEIHLADQPGNTATKRLALP